MRPPALPFLAAHGFGAARVTKMPGDASFRHYYRLEGGPRPALLMDAPPPQEDVQPFLQVASHIASLKLSAPQVLAADAEHGLVLLEDFGDDTLAALLDAGAEPLPLYLAAAEALAALHEASPPAGLPPWDSATMSARAADTFCQWWWPAAFGAEMPHEVRAEFDAAMLAVLRPFDGAGCFVHRDYWAANLMRLPGREGPARTGILDFQDAALGHPAYDLVSLVEDARRDIAPEIRDATIAHYLARRPGLNAQDFRAALAACAAQRHLRVAALWVRLAKRDSKPRYLIHGPRCWSLLDRALQHEAAKPLQEFLDAHVPVALRKNPTALVPESIA